MNNLIKIKIAMLFMACGLLITSCEKEGNDILPNSAQNTNSKSSATPTKSGGGFPSDYWDNLQQFIFDVMEGNDLSDMEIEKALYYTESTMDWMLTNSNEKHFEYETSGSEISINLSGLTQVGQGYEISGSALEDLNYELKDSISDQAHAIAQSNNDSVYVTTVDLRWDINSGSTNVYATAYFGITKRQAPSCNFSDRKAGIRENCGGFFRSTTAYEQINSRTSPLSCFTWRDKLNCSSKLMVNIQRYTINGISGCPNGFTPFSGHEQACLTHADHQRQHDDAREAWNNQCSQISNINEPLKSVKFEGDHFSNAVNFKTTYVTASCQQLCLQPSCVNVIHKPEPLWDFNGIHCVLPKPPC